MLRVPLGRILGCQGSSARTPFWSFLVAPQVRGCLDTHHPGPHLPHQLSISVSLLLFQDSEIRNNAANYLPQISQLLNDVPRQMLLIFKTNDLLRGIEAALSTRASSSSFLSMSRCCIRALAA